MIFVLAHANYLFVHLMIFVMHFIFEIAHVIYIVGHMINIVAHLKNGVAHLRFLLTHMRNFITHMINLIVHLSIVLAHMKQRVIFFIFGKGWACAIWIFRFVISFHTLSMCQLGRLCWFLSIDCHSLLWVLCVSSNFGLVKVDMGYLSIWVNCWYGSWCWYESFCLIWVNWCRYGSLVRYGSIYNMGLDWLKHDWLVFEIDFWYETWSLIGYLIFDTSHVMNLLIYFWYDA